MSTLEVAWIIAKMVFVVGGVVFAIGFLVTIVRSFKSYKKNGWW